MAAGPDDRDLSRYVVLAVAGPRVTPETVDAPSMLELAAAFFQLVKASAEESGTPITLTGIEIINKCAALCVVPDELEVARENAEQSLGYIGGADPPRGLVDLTKRARLAVEALPHETSAKILIGPWVRTIPRASSAPPHLLDSILAIPARPLRAGGRKPTVRFTSEMEEHDFTLNVTQEQARSLGAKLYQSVLIEAHVIRDAEGLITAGRLDTFEALQTGDPLPAWRAWGEEVRRPPTRKRKKEH